MQKKERSKYLQDIPETEAQKFMEFDGTGLRNVPGIYILENLSTYKTYVGSSKNLAARILRHRSDLINGIHINKKLQDSFNKTKDKNNWVIHIGLLDNREEALNREQLILDEGHGTKHLLNISPWARRGFNKELEEQRLQKLLDFVRSPEHRKNTSEHSKLKWLNEDFRKRCIYSMGKNIEVNGIKYGSIREASRETGYSVATIKSKLIDDKAFIDKIKTSRKVICEGIIYDSITAASLAYGIVDSAMHWRINSKSYLWKDFKYVD